VGKTVVVLSTIRFIRPTENLYLHEQNLEFPSRRGRRAVSPPDKSTTPIYLTLKGAESEDIMRLMMEVDAYQQAGYHNLNLYMPYVPYGRQDRVTTEGTNFGLSMFVQILKLAGFREIVIVDPHSSVTVDLLEDACLNLVVIEQHELLDSIPLKPGRNNGSLWRLIKAQSVARRKQLKS
jgi:N-terminal domain of ribose phosphate pyrophosphokinase